LFLIQPVVLLISGRYLRYGTREGFSQVVSWFAALGILLGVMALIVVLSVMNGFEQQLTSRILRLVPQAVVTTSTGQLSRSRYPLSLLQPLVIPDLRAMAPLTTAEVVLQSDQGIALGTLLGIDPAAPEPLAHRIVQGRFSALQPQCWQVIIGVTLARQLRVRVGDQLRLIATSTRQFTPLGSWPSQRLFTVAGLFSVGSLVDSSQVLVHQEDARRLLGYPPGIISGWRLFFNHPLRSALIPPTLPAGLCGYDWRKSYGPLFQAVNLEKRMMSLLLILIIAVGGFNIITALGMQVLERATEVAILQTIGLTRGAIVLLFMIQGASRTVVGSLFGTLSGVGISCYLTEISDRLRLPGLVGTALPVDIQPAQILLVLLGTTGVTLLATLYPAWQAAACEPSESLQHAG
jgi:lipoprotein-releasing system permease protein